MSAWPLLCSSLPLQTTGKMVTERKVKVFLVPCFSLHVIHMLLFCVLFVEVVAPDTGTACDIPSVGRGSSTSLSCYFPEDVVKSKKSFVVHHFINQSRKEILTCEWNQSIICSTAPGYAIDMNLTSTVTVKIPRVSETYVGNYSCQFAHVAVGDYKYCEFHLEQEKVTSCNIPPVKLTEPATLTCIFNVDVNRTKTNFNVVFYGYETGEGANVLNCRWRDDHGLVCDVSSGYAYTGTVTDRITILIPKANPSHTGKYLCRMQNSNYSTKDCEFLIDTENENHVPVVAGVLIPVLLLVLGGAFYLIYRRRRHRMRIPVSPDGEEMQVMLTRREEEVTDDFKTYLTASFHQMYHDIDTRYYFVPSLYLNRHTYLKARFPDESVFVMDDNHQKYDLAMQKILRLLRHLAVREKEPMFVISQFNYDNYLTTSEHDFRDHQLPMPDIPREQDKIYGSFDILIVHRNYGLLVGKVKTTPVRIPSYVDTFVIPCPWFMESTKSTVEGETLNGISQLENAKKMIRYLLSDQEWDVPVRTILMFPNIRQFQQDVRGVTFCLYGEQLTSECLKQCLRSRLTESNASPVINDEQYITIISRFCGPASRSPLPMPDTIPRDILPVTLEHAVCLTGDIFETTILYENHMDVLLEGQPRVCLCGPPSTGKTRTLALIGRQWRSQGHDVHVVSLTRTSRAASRMLVHMLKNKTKDMRPPKTRSRQGIVDLKELGLTQTITKFVKTLANLSKRKKLFVLCDEAESDREDSSFRSFCEELLKKVSNLHLWYTSCFGANVPGGWKEATFLKPLSCPPAILQQKQLIDAAIDCRILSWGKYFATQMPTNGPDVINIDHKGIGHSLCDPHDCQICCNKVVGYLRFLFTGKVTSSSKATSVKQVDGSNNPMPARLSELRLRQSDVLVLTECDLKEEAMIFKALKRSGFKPEKLKNKVFESIFTNEDENVLIAEGRHLHGIKKKVVAYFESGCGDTGVSNTFNKVRCLTSCTSQLIWVHIR